ncbi:amidase [Pelagicoccus sp. SDUM812003]|uniref:amidase n=1 Tax=Pelagicoccus sp. SDUM812003 TaxID=3041267 RepID=UPI00280EE272|nr:amidase [Pelagicoccus sp. SDUM812003]MDQ8204670.1 amidase [Pelagicoccus sp. SDUM812003]
MQNLPSIHLSKTRVRSVLALLGLLSIASLSRANGGFEPHEATIADVHAAIQEGRATSREIVESYLRRIQAYNGVCVEEPDGILGYVIPIPNAGQINALSTLNLRPASRQAWGFDERKARSMTDLVDDDPNMPDALEVADQLDEHFARTGELIGPLHGVVIAIKDQYDTFDLRTTAGADAFYANDRPPEDANFVKRLRAAGAIILAKSNLGEYASPQARSSFGGTFGNPYATDRYPGGSSGGSGSSVAASLVTVAIAEETGASIRTPARMNNLVGIAPTQELVSRHGMMGAGMNTRTGPIARTVEDAAIVLDVIAGYDPDDELTAFSVGRLPDEPYVSFARNPSLQGVRIAVVREFMDRSLFTVADEQSIALVEQAIEDLKELGATVLDPGEGGSLFQPYIDRYFPRGDNALFTAQYPERFPVNAEGQPTSDHLKELVSLNETPFTGPTMRSFGPAPTEGESRYWLETYLQRRGDENIKSIADLITKARFFRDDRFIDRQAALIERSKDTTLDTRNRMQRRFAIQQAVLQAMADLDIDALVYPTGNIPSPILGAPNEPNKNGRSGRSSWNILGQNGFAAISMPAGFTTEVYDRIEDPDTPGETILVGPVPAKLPVGVDFLGRPFSEPLLIRIAAAYEAGTGHREPPEGFPAL